MSPEWVAWAKDEIISLSKIVREKNAEIERLREKVKELEGENKTFCKFNKLFKQDCEEAREEGVRRFLEWSWDVDDLPTKTKDKRDDVKKMLQLWRAGRK